MLGPVSQYNIKYMLKDTQEDDMKPYSSFLKNTRKVVGMLKKYQMESSESIRRLLWSTFSHNKNNIIGPSLSSYITRNGSRFV